MIRRLLAVLGLTAALAIAIPTPPAEAGWSPQYCAQDQGPQPDADWRVCIQTYTEAATGGGYLLKRVLVCAWHIAGGGDKFRGAINASFREYTSTGLANGAIRLPDTPVGTCTNTGTGAYKGGPWSSGAGAFVAYSATADMALMTDRPMGLNAPCCTGGG